MLDLHRLWLLRELHLRGTLAAVAEAHSYSPSAVSQQLKVLEAEAGVALLEPVGRRVRLTRPAERLVEHTEAILAILEGARADLDSAHSAIAGTVRIAVFQTAAHALLPPALDALGASFPELRVLVSDREPETALPALVAGEFDLVLLEEYPALPQRRRPDIQYHHLMADPIQLAQPGDHPYSGLEELADRPWIMEPAGSLARAWAITVCRNAGFEPDVRYETSDLLLHTHLVRTGHAVAFLPALLSVHDDPAIRLDPLPGQPTRRISVATRRGASEHPALKAIRQVLGSVAKTGDPGQRQR
ncbi:LysR family transcriptional regulator [Fodinicola acaciae]|uniref:LysR family transcriptional regulator n=1 Tax=Fodinicola acaciae TaxID=2681555 RepID=UPI0013D7D30F|nr:LysR family transcriptional regulator [Fodinicola acaciae]